MCAVRVALAERTKDTSGYSRPDLVEENTTRRKDRAERSSHHYHEKSLLYELPRSSLSSYLIFQLSSEFAVRSSQVASTSHFMLDRLF
eukprot:scaffold11158_cov95-Skeletonema_marinoi.AAC.2